MKIEVRFVGLPASPSLEAYARRRALAQLGRYRPQVRAITVRLSDVNGPRGGPDKLCRITLSGPGVGSATIRETTEDYYTSVHLALHRADRKLGRILDRRQSRQRRASSRSGAAARSNRAQEEAA